MIKSILLSIFGLLYFACQSQIISQSGSGYNNFNLNSEDKVIPDTFVEGWVEDNTGKKKQNLILYKVKTRQLLLQKNGQVFALSGPIADFGFILNNVLERKFVYLSTPQNGYFEIIGSDKDIQILLFYNQIETESNSYGDVKRKIYEIETTFYLKSKSGIQKFTPKRKELVKLFPGNPILDNFLKAVRIDFKNIEDLTKLVNFLNQ